MNERTYSTINKTGWGDGPWQHEPDKVQWTDQATGMACLAKRHRENGFLCGYVGVATAHPWHGKEINDGDIWQLEVHGGISYTDPCEVDAPEATGICHVPDPGEPDGLWWFGFDCGHCFDHSPGAATAARRYGLEADPDDDARTYRTLHFVRDECARLAGQLAAISGSP